jgi:hypothetical protein
MNKKVSNFNIKQQEIVRERQSEKDQMSEKNKQYIEWTWCNLE